MVLLKGLVVDGMDDRVEFLALETMVVAQWDYAVEILLERRAHCEVATLLEMVGACGMRAHLEGMEKDEEASLLGEMGDCVVVVEENTGSGSRSYQ